MPSIAYAQHRNTSLYHGLQLAQSTAVVALLAPHSRVTVMLIILVVSMIAVSFPAASSSGIVAIPNMLFFIGKHFGTGVILATAFVHLLPDSFHSLMDKSVEKQYGDVGNWVGLIILGSLLAIFLVEYVSTTFVDHLHADPSAPSSPDIPTEPLPIVASPTLLQEPSVLLPFLANTPKIIRLRDSNLQCVCQNGVCVCVPTTEAPGEEENAQVREHHRRDHDHDHDHDHHLHHHRLEKRRIGRRRQIVSIFVLQVGIMIHSLVIGLTLSITSGTDFTSLTTAIIFHQIFEGLSLGIRIAALPQEMPTASEDHLDDDEDDLEGRHGSPSAPSISELDGLGSLVRPELRGIHSAETTAPRLELHLNPEFAFAERTSEDDINTASLANSSRSLKKKSTSELSTRQRPPALHHDSHHRHSSWRDWPRSLFHRSTSQPLNHHSHDHHHHYGATTHSHSHSPIVPSAESSEERLTHLKAKTSRWSLLSFNPLKTALSVLFAVTTPAGMGLGLLLWKGGKDGASEEVSMKLTKGVMSAVSAGMLIYAATVEMIAGDFVYGDLEGHHHHGADHLSHEHEHDHHHHEPHGRSPHGAGSDSASGVGHQHGHDDEHNHQHHHHHPSIKKRVVAVGSLMLGVMAMTLIGLGEPRH